VIWHIVRFDMTHLDETVRRDMEASLERLEALDEVRWLRVARDVEDPGVTGLITVFDDVDALARYRVHPDHVPVVARVGELGIGTMRLDIATDDASADLP
jgi:hypothetical protein